MLARIYPYSKTCMTVPGTGTWYTVPGTVYQLMRFPFKMIQQVNEFTFLGIIHQIRLHYTLVRFSKNPEH